MIGAFLFCGMGVVAGIAVGATKMGKDAEYRDREALARKRVEAILEEGRCDSRCAGCPVELLCQKRIDRQMTVKDCCKLWMRQRDYLEKDSPLSQKGAVNGEGFSRENEERA